MTKTIALQQRGYGAPLCTLVVDKIQAWSVEHGSRSYTKVWLQGRGTPLQLEGDFGCELEKAVKEA